LQDVPLTLPKRTKADCDKARDQVPRSYRNMYHH